MTEVDLKRFAEIVRQRRLALGLRQEEVRDAGGPALRRQTQIEQGVPPVPSVSTLARVDKSLQWAPGSAARTLQGGLPLPAQTPQITEEDVERRVNLALALQRAGVTRIGTRLTNEEPDRFGLSPSVVDQLIEILNSLPDAENGAQQDLSQ
ncbi:MAG: helix-turn-helix domain-containing protein [Rhodococcus sp.]|nr:helix-turn-helix domain-containing protein [Rhodococcus sp. (in: high G+C Gram-positive bacteria)]